ncbi:hypothetical protein [Bradyrhizobium guangdongense]
MAVLIDTDNDVWPLCAGDGSPLAWWRMLPMHHFRNSERLVVRLALKGIAVIDGGEELAAALRGDPAGAIAAALALVPIRKLSLPVDITMTALLRSALEDDAAAALVLSHVIGRIEFNHLFAAELATSWLTHHLRSARDPHRFRQAEAALSDYLCPEENEA